MHHPRVTDRRFRSTDVIDARGIGLSVLGGHKIGHSQELALDQANIEVL